MAPVIPGSINYHTLSCGHTTQGMRCIEAKVACSDKLLGDGNNYDNEVVKQTDAKMAEAVEKGMKWVVISRTVEYMYPMLFGLLSASRNVAGNITRCAHEVQGITQMFRAWATSLKAGAGEFDLQAVKRAILRQKPFFADDLDHFYQFLHARAGGVDGAFWLNFVDFHTRFVTPSLRTMSGEMFAALADFPQQRLAYAILKAAYTCPKEHISGRRCVWITPHETARLTDNKKKRSAITSPRLKRFCSSFLAPLLIPYKGHRPASG